MAAGEQDILREYLVALGFKVDAASKVRFGGELSKLDRQATALGKTFVGVAVAAQAMATEFAYRMEKLYYSSKLAESSAGNLQAIQFAGKQSGIADMTKNVEALARSLRSNPGLQGLLNSLGVKVEGRDRADVLFDLVKTLKTMPFYIAERYANIFGISPDDLLLMEQGLDKMHEAVALRKQVAEGLGIDTEKAAKAGLEYAQEWREILMYVGLFRDAVTLQLLPSMHELAQVTKEVLSDWVKIVQNDKGKRGITEASAAASGLSSADEQKRIAAAATSGKHWSEMTPQERASRGMPEDDHGKPWTVWDYLTPEERKAKGLPATEEEMNFGWRLKRKLGRGIDNALTYYGIKSGATEGGVELSDQSKERLGGNRFDASNPSPMRKALQDAVGYTPIPKTPIDPAAIEAATAPDRVLIERQGSPATGDPSAAQASPQITAPPGAGKNPEAQAILRTLESQRGLPKGLLDYIWARESNRLAGGNLTSSAGAVGPFQLMPETSKSLGVKNPGDFKEAAAGAADLMAELMKHYGNDMRYALAAYNWNPGSLDKLLGKTMEQHGDWSAAQVDQFVLGHLPAETRKYLSGIGSDDGAPGGGTNITIHSDNKFNISGATSPRDTADQIARHNREMWAELTRDFLPRVQ